MAKSISIPSLDIEEQYGNKSNLSLSPSFLKKLKHSIELFSKKESLSEAPRKSLIVKSEADHLDPGLLGEQQESSESS